MPDNIFNILTLKRTKSPQQEQEVFTPEDLGKLFRNEGFRALEKGEKKAFHSFRHTFLLACKESGMPHEMVAQFVGHETSHKDMTGVME